MHRFQILDSKDCNHCDRCSMVGIQIPNKKFKVKLSKHFLIKYGCLKQGKISISNCPLNDDCIGFG